MARVGRVDTNALIEGRLLLDEIGMAEEVDRLLRAPALQSGQLIELKRKA